MPEHRLRIELNSQYIESGHRAENERISSGLDNGPC